MPVRVKCSCGKVLGVPDQALGKQVKCPACGRSFLAAASGAGGQKIRVTCACGAAFQAPPKLAGKSVKCSKCGGTISVPAGGAPAQQPREEVEAEEGGTYEVDRPKCMRCGATLDAGAVFCTACGTHQMTGQKAEQFSGQVQVSRSGPAVPMPAIAAVIALVVVAGGLVWYFGAHKKGEASGAPAASASESEAASPAANAPKKPSAASSGSTGAAAEASRSESPKASPPATQSASPGGAKAETAPAQPPKPPQVKKEVVQPKKVFGDDSEWYIERVVYSPTRARDRLSIVTAEDAVKKFQLAEGRRPKDLDEVVKMGYGPLNQPADGVELGYDPKTDKVNLYRTEKRRKQ